MTSRHKHRRTRTRTAVAVLTAATAVMTGCSSTTPQAAPETETVTDTAARTPVLIPAAPGDLDPGPYRTTPHDRLPTVAGDASLGGFLESQRMAEFLVLPAEVDPELTDPDLDYTRTIFDSSALEFLIANGNPAVTAAGDDTGFYAGYSTTRSNNAAGTGMTHAVLEFPDAAAAADAAAALHRLLIAPDLSAPTDGQSPRPVAYPQAGMPGSHVSALLSEDLIRATAFTPHGRYVLFTRVHGPRDREDWAQTSMARAAELQRPMIDLFPFTEPADLPGLEVDIDGVLRLAVPYLPDDESGSVPAVYGPRGAAHLGDQLETLDMFADTATTHMAMSGTYVYAAEYDDQAQQLFDRLIGHIRDRHDGVSLVSAAGPPGVLDTRCFEVITEFSEYATCVVLYDTYVGEIRASTLQAAHQVTTAQYLILDTNAA